MKVLKLIKLFFQRNFVFRLNFFMLWITTIIKFSFIILFWLSAMKNSSSNFLYTNKEIIIYFFVIMLISLFLESDIADKVSNSIYDGNISTDLLKPISHFSLSFSDCVASKLFIFGIIICVSIVLHFIPSYSSLFSLSLVISFIISFEMNYIIGLFAFWTNTVWGISMVNSVLIDVFGGRLFPISIANPLMKNICAILPYQYIYYVPTQILENKMNAFMILIQVLYAIILFLISQIVFKLGLKRFEAAGV